MPDQLTIDDFRHLDGSDIELLFGQHFQIGQIIEVSAHAGGMPGGRQSFSVIIRSGPVDCCWPQGTYTLVHPRRGKLKLFMVPVGPDDSGMRYQVSFS